MQNAKGEGYAKGFGEKARKRETTRNIYMNVQG
jgi:hypothetical protein